MTLDKLWHKLYIDPRRRRKMRRYGMANLLAIDGAMRRCGVPYSLVYGSLLGAVREKGFIPHDDDIDIAVWADEDYGGVFRDLGDAGFHKTREILVDGGRFGREETWKCHSIDVDFFFFFPDGKGGYYGTEFYNQDGCGDWDESVRRFGGLKVLKTLLPISKETEYVPFEDKEISVTVDALAFVKEYYGPGWRVPDPSFIYPRKGETNYEEIPDKTGVISAF